MFREKTQELLELYPENKKIWNIYNMIYIFFYIREILPDESVTVKNV